MTIEIVLVLGISLGAMILFITEVMRVDAIAMSVLVSLALLGLISPTEALSGFSNPATITVASMFILAAGLERSGALNGISRLLSQAKTPRSFSFMLFGLLALVAPFVNNTALVAVFIPIVITASLSIGIAPSKSLIPLSYVSQMTGVWTLIGTSTNLIVNSVAKDLGYEGFSMFQFLPLGIICWVAGVAYLLTLGRWLLPDVKSSDLENLYEFGHYLVELYVGEECDLIGTTAEEKKLGEKHGIYLLELIRGDEKFKLPRSEKIKVGDVLLVRGNWSKIEKLTEESKLEINHQLQFNPKVENHIKWMITEVMIAPNSRVAGSRLASFNRSWRSHSRVLGIQRRGQILRTKLKEVRLRIGDILLLAIPETELAELRKDKGIIILSERNNPKRRWWRAPFALIVMALVVLSAAINLVPIAIAALVGALAVIFAGCIHADEVYDTTDWSVIVLMAGLLPLGLAMSSSGAAQFIVDNTIGLVQDLGPHVVLAVLYLMALLLGEMMSNSASAVLLTPIGISTAHLMGTDATPFLIAITFSASTSFLTPVGYQTNTMVYNAGGYQFTDFIKVGLPLNLIFWVLGVIFIPIFWPF